MHAATPPAVIQPAPARVHDPAALAAAGGFLMGCFSALDQATSAADYADKVQGLKSQLPADASGPTSQVDFSPVDGRTCRVIYIGPNALRLFDAFADFRPEKRFGPCTEGRRTATHATISCAPGSEPGIAVLVDQQGTSPTFRLVASVTFVAPATHPVDVHGNPIPSVH